MSNITHDDNGPRIDQLDEVANSRLISAWIISGIVWLISIVLYSILYFKHAQSLKQSLPSSGYGSRISIELSMKIILFGPIYSTCAYFSLFFFRAALLMDLVRTVYEAFVLWYFIRLLLILLGEPQQAEQALQQTKPQRLIASPPCCCCLVCFPKFRLQYSYIWILLLGVRQLCFIRPVVAFISLIMTLNASSFRDGLVAKDSGYIYLDTADQISLLLALYCLFIFWKATRDVLKDHHPGVKFLAIKLGLIIVIIQKYIISIFVSKDVIHDDDLMPAHVKAEAWNNFCIIFEFFLIYFIFARGFPVYSAEETRLVGNEPSSTDMNINIKYNQQQQQQQHQHQPEQEDYPLQQTQAVKQADIESAPEAIVHDKTV